MACERFCAILPQRLQIGDEVVLKGKIEDEARDMSINFVSGTSSYSDEVVFQLQFKDGQVHQNWKKNNEWIIDENPEEDPLFTVDLRGFEVTFRFDTDEIFVYTGDEDRSMLYQFRPFIPISHISSVQVWNDVKKVDEIRFRYA